jgi:hypothetical protein
MSTLLLVVERMFIRRRFWENDKTQEFSRNHENCDGIDNHSDEVYSSDKNRLEIDISRVLEKLVFYLLTIHQKCLTNSYPFTQEELIFRFIRTSHDKILR